MRNVLAPAPHPEPASRLKSKIHVDSFLRNASSDGDSALRSAQF